MIVLGLEASCDETAAAVVDMDAPRDTRILSSVIWSQIDQHRAFGGVVPEIAARAHLSAMDRVMAKALEEANTPQIDLVAATAGPGLIGGLIVATASGRAYAQALGLPYQDVNHLAGHGLTARLTDDIPYPYLLLLISGGHSQILVVKGCHAFERLGTTIDDAVGEAFDKVAKLLGLGFPGGPALEKCAYPGDPQRFALPVPLKNRPGFDFSFSGLKTAVRRALELLPSPEDQDRADLAASFQAAAAESLAVKTRKAMSYIKEVYGQPLPLAVAGGVAANATICATLEGIARDFSVPLYSAPLSLCGDNAAMIAYAGGEQWAARQEQVWDMAPRPRWPLEELES